jgi:hypothetical protein
MLDPQLLHSIGEAPDFDALTKRVVKAVNGLGFGLVSGALVQGRLGSSGGLVTSFGNPPEAYLQSATSLTDGLRDPVLGQILARPGIVKYDQSTYVEAGSADLWDLQAAFGYKFGVTIAHHAPSHGEVFFLGVDGPDRLPVNAVAALQLHAALRLLALQAQQCVERIARPTLDERAPLEWAGSIREGALSYAARGGLVKIEDLRRALQR